MVDRMFNRPKLRETVRDLTQTDDECAVAAEPFSQWVIEDTFPAADPRGKGSGSTSSVT